MQVEESAPLIRDRSRSPPSREGCDADANLHMENDDSNVTDLGWSQLWEGLDDLGDIDPTAPIRPGDEGQSAPTLQEVLLTVLDWYAAHKQTYTATSDMLKILLKHRYVRALWDADMDDSFALLRYEAY